MKKEKIVGLVLSLILLLGFIVGCSSSTDTNSPTGNSSTGDGGASSDDPIMELSFFMNDNLNSQVVTSYEEIEAFKEIQKQTNTKIEFLLPGDGTAFNIMLASNDYPDIMYVPNNYPGGIAKLVEDGVALRLNELIDEHAPNYKKILDDYPDIRKQIALDDGTIAKFPQIDIDLHRMAYSGHMIREDWLNKLGLDPPNTIEEWYSVLTAFKENDMNGEGAGHAIPLGERGDNLSTLNSFAPSWGVLADRFQLDPDSGKVTYGPIEPTYKDYLATMHQWYDEGLIDPEFPALDRTAFNTKFATNAIGAYGAVISGINTFKDLMSDEIPEFKLIGLSPPIGPAGKSYSGHSQMAMNVPLDGAVISSHAKDPVAMIKLLDFMIGPEGSDLQSWGILGESYTIEDGKKQYTDLIWNDPQGFGPTDAIKKYALPTMGNVKVMDYHAWAAFELKYPEAEEANKLWFDADRSLLLPALTFTGDESQIVNKIMSEVNTYQKEMRLKFILGVESIDMFDDYVETLIKMGIEEAIQIHQNAYDRFQNR